MFKRIVLVTDDGETIELAGYMIREVTMTVDESHVSVDIEVVIPKIRWPSYGYGRAPRGRSWMDRSGAMNHLVGREYEVRVPTGLLNDPPQKAVPPSPVVDPSRLLKEKNEP